VKIAGSLEHDEIVQALVDFIKRNHPTHAVTPTNVAVVRDNDGNLSASFSLEYATTPARFDSARGCSMCKEAGHNASTCWRNGTPTPAPNT
jgi:hypothetical protein